MAFYANTSGGTVSAPATIGKGFVRMDVTMLDVDGDGSQDVIAVDNVGQMKLFRSNGAGAFISEARPQIGGGWNAMNSISPAHGFAAAGSTGLIARDTAGNLSYYPLAKGVLGAKKAVGTGWVNTLIAGSATINRQQPITSQSDVLRVDDAGKLWTHPASGTGVLTAPYQIGSGWSGAKTLHVLDWNKDGVPDVLAQWNSGALNVYLGSKAGGFTGPISLASAGFAQTTFVTGRWVTGSAYPGLVGYGSNGELSFWANASGTALSAPVRIGTGWNGMKLAMVDFDTDGHQDLLAVAGTGSMKLYRSTGANKFVPETRKVVGTGWQTFRQFSATAGFAGAAGNGVLALQTTGQLRYYSVASTGAWGPVSTAGTVGSASLVSRSSAAG